MLPTSSINSNLILLLVGAFVGILIVQGILSSLRGIWAPVQQPVNGPIGNGSGTSLFYLLIIGLLLLYFSGFFNQNEEPQKPLNPVRYPAHGFKTPATKPLESTLSFSEQDQVQIENNPRDYDFDYNVKSVEDDRYQEAVVVLDRYVVQYLAGNDYAAVISKKGQLQDKYKGFSIYIADQGGALPYKLLIGDFASDFDARGFIKMYGLNDSFIRKIGDYQLIEK